jgi:hypothetical protein
VAVAVGGWLWISDDPSQKAPASLPGSTVTSHPILKPRLSPKIPDGWQNLATPFYTIAYPPGWKATSFIEFEPSQRFPETSVLTITSSSSGFLPQRDYPYSPQAGAILALYIGRQQFPLDRSLGLVAERNVYWLAEPAKLEKSPYPPQFLLWR